MARDPLHTLIRLREAALDDARRATALALAEEESARGRLVQADGLLKRETAIAQASAEDGQVEQYAAWLPIGCRAVSVAEQAVAMAVFTTAHRRAELTLARASAEAAASALLHKQEQQQMQRVRRQQAELDEVGRGRRAGAGPRQG